MQLISKTLKPTSLLLAVFMLLISVPYQTAAAAMIGTDAMLDGPSVQHTRDYLNQLMSRQEIQEALVARGIDPLEGKARIESLSDCEIARISEQIENLPAGGGVLGFLFLIALVIFAVLVVTDYTGATDIFTFVGPR